MGNIPASASGSTNGSLSRYLAGGAVFATALLIALIVTLMRGRRFGSIRVISSAGRAQDRKLTAVAVQPRAWASDIIPCMYTE